MSRQRHPKHRGPKHREAPEEILPPLHYGDGPAFQALAARAPNSLITVARAGFFFSPQS
jgi:hypothetical protein